MLQKYLDRGRAWVELAKRGPEPAERQSMLRLVQRLWLAALFLKVLGSSWDVSWHFRWLRDDLAPPHLLNTVGTVLAIALVVFHSYTRFGVDKIGLRFLQVGAGVFLAAIPIDILNHRINGLDITSWSPSHALLYLGTAGMIAGLLRSWRVTGAPLLYLGVLWVFFFENTLFPAQHQEYGVLEIIGWQAGHPSAERELLEFAANQIGHPVSDATVTQFALPVAGWVYPVWLSVAAMIVLVCARHFLSRPWAATAVAGVYVLYRCVAWALLAGTGFPESAVPVALLAGAIVVDLAFFAPALIRPLFAVGVVAAVYGGLWLQAEYLQAPPLVPASLPYSVGALLVLWAGLTYLAARANSSDRPLAEAPEVTAR